MLNSICDVPGVRVGHAHDLTARTGCTVILPAQPAVAGVEVGGSAPGTREIELLRPVRLVQEIHGLLLTGGSAFGLDAAGGVQRYLEERGIGFDVGVTRVPIVPAAVIFDLAVGAAHVRPNADMAYAACKSASTSEAGQGAIGAGCGATLGKIRGLRYCMTGGVGTASWRKDGIVVGALVVVNALGDVVDSHTGKLVAGARRDDGNLLDSLAHLKANPVSPLITWGNTTLAVVATNVGFNKEQCTKVAEMARDGVAAAIRPAHTPYDGDITFAMSLGSARAEVMSIGAIAAELVATAIVRAARASNDLA